MAVIREAKNEDTAVLEEIFQITRQKTFQQTPAEDFKLGDYKKQTEGEEVWLIEEDGRAVGFISLYLPDDFIHHLFVHPDFQGRGYGQQLLKKAEVRLARPMTLKVSMDNIKVCLFYEKYGWKKTSVHEQEAYILLSKD